MSNDLASANGGHPDSPPVLSEENAELVSGLAAMLIDIVVPFSIAVTDHIHEHVEEVPDDDEAMEATRQAAEGSPREILSTLRAKMPPSSHETPVEAIEYARFLQSRGVGAKTLIRVYQVGVAMFRHVVTNELTPRLSDPAHRAVIQDAIDDYLFRYIDTVTSRLVAEYGLTSGGWYPTASDPVFSNPETAAAALKLRDDELAKGRWLASSPQESSARQDAERTLDAFAATIEQAAQNRSLSNKLARSDLTLEVTLADEPDLSVTILMDRNPVEVVDSTSTDAEVHIWIASVDLKRIWSRDFYLPMAIARGRVRVTGPVRKFLRVVPILRVLAPSHEQIWLSMQTEKDRVG